MERSGGVGESDKLTKSSTSAGDIFDGISISGVWGKVLFLRQV